MAKFLFTLMQHSEVGKRSLEDVIGICIHQLRALGHWARWDPQNDLQPTPMLCHGPDEYNIIVEGFTPGFIDFIAKAKAQLGAKFICLATEEPTDQGFNYGLQGGMAERQALFGEAMRHFEGILHLVPGERITKWYSQFGIPAAQTELGYSSYLVFPETQRGEPPFDFGFYGSLTPRREELLLRLSKRAGRKIRIVNDFKTAEERNRAMQEAKVVLQVRKESAMGLISSSRCNTALHIGRPVIAEPHDVDLSQNWSDVVRIAKTEEDFINLAILTARRWRDAHAMQLERFKKRLTPAYCIGEPLARIGITGGARKAA